MRGLTIVIGDAHPERLRTALTLAAANAALGGRTRLFFEGEAVALLEPPIAGPADDLHATTGLPTLAALFEDALSLGVELIACQSALALTGISAVAFDPRIAFGGPVSLLQSLAEDRLVLG